MLESMRLVKNDEEKRTKKEGLEPLFTSYIFDIPCKDSYFRWIS